MTTYISGVPGYATIPEYMALTGALKATLSYRIRQKLPLEGVESVHQFGRLYLLKLAKKKKNRNKK